VLKILNSDFGHLVARNGILAIILAYSLYVNKELTAKLFTVIENNTAAMIEFKSALKGISQ
jgi:hypothetical protein